MGIRERTGALKNLSNIQMYSNPSNGILNITFSISRTQKVNCSIYNPAGRRIKRLFSGSAGSGRHSIVWNGTDDNSILVKSGIYQ
ncbi:hypothetical protein BXT86_03965 [candidate division WOR-3 bacterium 4484_100]|uniref:FlgD/Vpr Ig-like domain-containing protein n=1 Tax=candidate division WOR-3 bacterium 4484_100 TaxID=1936077 RepID=A0A1V4QGB5_UNCW3|nr:MAG: hypothetical protein BXT86_03965 [candidate division WOR-3 bacterium 4484_100]